MTLAVMKAGTVEDTTRDSDLMTTRGSLKNHTLGMSVAVGLCVSAVNVVSADSAILFPLLNLYCIYTFLKKKVNLKKNVELD